MSEQHVNQHLALEMTMQEVLGNLEELALDFGYSDGEDCFEILAIEPCQVPDLKSGHKPDNRVRAPFDATTLSPRSRVA